MKPLFRHQNLTISLVSALLILCGCSAAHYRKSADAEAYKAIAGKSGLVKNSEPQFNIEQTNRIVLDFLPVQKEAADFLGTDGAAEVGAHIVSLDESLKLAVQHNRSYQSRKESLYLSALSLTLARHQFTPLFNAGVKGGVAGQTQQAVDGLIEDQSVSVSGSADSSWLIRDVGRISASFTTDFLRFITGDPRTFTSSRLGATFSRPLLRNANFKSQIEALTQSERNLLYDLRVFTQFRKDFSVQVASAYYDVLGRRDAARNSFLTLQSSRTNAVRTRALAAEGRISQADLGRLEQQELDAENSWNSAVLAYKQTLDRFKLTQLGIPVTVNVALDDKDLTALLIENPTLGIDESIEIALASRMDFMNVKDRHDDALREVGLTKDFLKPQVDLVADAAIVNDPARGGRLNFPDASRYSWSAGLDVNLPLDRKSERNSYRAALIAEKSAARAVEQQEDQIRLDVRDSWRTLDQAKRTYEISEIQVKINERRVEEQTILSELGRAKAQDQVDAQNALNASKNQRTQALVTHTIQRLQFWNNMGILFIKDNGRWEELKNAGKN
jgi:outer membrane protein TolC